MVVIVEDLTNAGRNLEVVQKRQADRTVVLCYGKKVARCCAPVATDIDS